jgi:hypothetical protein
MTSRSTFTIPPGVNLTQFNGSNWVEWSGNIEAILMLCEVEAMLLHSAPPSGFDQDDWTSLQRRTKAYLCLYIKPDIYSLIASDMDYPTFKDKWNKLRDTYGGASGSTTVFNLWIQLTQA